MTVAVGSDQVFTTTGAATTAALNTAVNARIQKREIPWYYAPGARTRLLLQAIASEIQLIRDACFDAYNQTYARRSTWTIDIQESDYALTPEPTTPLNQRQDRLVSAMRMLGTADLKRIKAICQSYVFGDVDVIPDPAHYVIVIQFKSQQGLPANLSDLKAQVRTRIPPPWDIQYLSRYTKYGDIKVAGKTYGQLKALGLQYGAIKLWRPV